MLVLSPWLKPATNRSFQAAEAWEGAARAITTAAQRAARAAAVRGTYPAPSCSIRGRCPTGTARVKARRSRFTESLRGSHKSVRVEAGRRRPAVAQHLRVQPRELRVIGRVRRQVLQ